MDPLIGPIPPVNQIHAWGVEEWIDYFDRHDRFRCALLEAMHGEPQTLGAIERALVRAREIDRRWGAAAERRLDELMAETRRRAARPPEDREPWKASLPAAVTEDAAPWQESLPRFEPPHYHSIDVDACPAYRQAREVLIEFGRRLSERGQRSDPPPVLAYVVALLTRGAFGFCYGDVWAEQGFPHARRARDLLSARRFRTAARVLAAHPEHGLASVSHAARAAACALLERATRR